MTWRVLEDFIRRNQFTILNKSEGIPLESIRAWEEKFGLMLPQGYKDFLHIMGANKEFNAFGRAEHNFFTLTKNLPSKHYLIELFRIAHDSKNDLNNPIDLFIDLTETTAYDAALFEYEPYNEFRANEVKRITLSLMEILTRQLLLSGIDFNDHLSTYANKSSILDRLLNLGFTKELPSQKSLDFISNKSSKVLLELYEEDDWGTNLVIYIKGDSEDIKRNILELSHSKYQ